jgi:hypothetical protein
MVNSGLMRNVQNWFIKGSTLNYSGCRTHTIAFNFTSEYTIRRAQENQDGLKLIGTHQLLAYADDIDIVGENIHTIKKNTEAVLGGSKEVGQEASPEKTKYILMPCNQKIGKSIAKDSEQVL